MTSEFEPEQIPTYSWGATSATHSEIMRYGNRREKREEIISSSCAVVVETGVLLGPLVFGLFEQIAGTITNDPDRSQRGTNIAFGEFGLLLVTGALLKAAEQTRSFARRIHINQTPSEIAIRYRRHPESDLPNSSN